MGVVSLKKRAKKHYNQEQRLDEEDWLDINPKDEPQEEFTTTVQGDPQPLQQEAEEGQGQLLQEELQVQDRVQTQET